MEARKQEPECEREWWLSQAMIRLGQLPTNGERDLGLYRLAMKLLKGIEASSLPVPIIRRGKTGTIYIVWAQGPRSLEIAVSGPDRYQMLYYDPGKAEDPTSHVGGHVDPVRTAVSRLFQWANSGTYHEMVSY